MHSARMASFDWPCSSFDFRYSSGRGSSKESAQLPRRHLCEKLCHHFFGQQWTCSNFEIVFSLSFCRPGDCPLALFDAYPFECLFWNSAPCLWYLAGRPSCPHSQIWVLRQPWPSHCPLDAEFAWYFSSHSGNNWMCSSMQPSWPCLRSADCFWPQFLFSSFQTELNYYSATHFIIVANYYWN